MTSHRKVFITGASSLLLREVINLIDLQSFEVTGLTRSETSFLPEGVLRCVGDILEPNTYRSQIKSSDIIIHGAALTHSKDASRYFDVNVQGTEKVLSQIPDGSSPTIVFISSRTAGLNSGAYGRSKIEAENTVKKTAKNWLILRPSEVFGGPKLEGIDSMIKSSLQGGLVPCPVGEKSKMFPIHVTDVGRAIHSSVFENTDLNQIKHINGIKGYTYKELLQLISAITGNKIIPLPVPKVALQLAAKISSILHISVGFVPDQVERLYSKKEHDSEVDYQTVSLEDYINELVLR